MNTLQFQAEGFRTCIGGQVLLEVGQARHELQAGLRRLRRQAGL